MKNTNLAITAFLFLTINCKIIAQSFENPSFEVGINNQPLDWKFETRDKGISSDWTDIPHSGNKSLAIIGDEKGWAHWFTKTPLKPYSRYCFSGWIKTENVTGENNAGAGFKIGDLEIQGIKAVSGTTGWQKIEFEFDTRGDDSGLIECILGLGGKAAGKAWFDDLKLELVSSKKLSPFVTIDINKQKEPISKYIFGQFIEHLGRCIYGGIWAEVVNDRKFYYMPGEGESPWRIIGDNKFLAASPSPYVGYNSPQLSNDNANQVSGIFQENIPLLANMDYIGHIILSGESKNAEITITLSWGEKGDQQKSLRINEITSEYRNYPIRFHSDVTTEKAILAIELKGKGKITIGTLSLMPANNINGFRSDVIALLKELNSPVYRWPGGNFVSGYNWKDGIGDRDRRPPRKNPAWTGVEHNDVGIDEFIQFCRILNAEPYIAVNSGLGDISMASEEVEYCNGATGTTMGHLRADFGNPEPYKVKFWSVGNEMYGSWQLGHMPLEDYVKKHNVFAQAMKKVDSTIVLVGVGSAGKWDEAMLNNCADYMDLISEHIYRQDWHGGGLMTHTKQLADDIRNIAKAHRDYRSIIPSLKGKDIRIAMDEWNYWYGPYLYGELGTRYFWRDGLGVAIGLHEYFRNSDMYFMANYAQTVNVIGCIKTTGTAAAFETTGLVLKFYRELFGNLPVEITGSPEPLDVVAALNENKTTLTLAVVNPTSKIYQLPFKLIGSGMKTIEKYYIQSGDEMAYNEPGIAPRIKIEKNTLKKPINNLKIDPGSVNIFVINLSN